MGLDVEGGGDANEGKDLRVGFSVFDDAEVGHFHVDDRGQIGLGHAECFAARSNGFPHSFEVRCIVAYAFFHTSKYKEKDENSGMKIHNC